MGKTLLAPGSVHWQPEFERLLQTQPMLGYRMTKVLAQRRREVESKIENLVFKDVNSKLAELLLRLATEYGVDDSRGTLVALKITHQEMANLIGSTRETVSLTLAQFKRKGLIQTEGRKVIISDLFFHLKESIMPRTTASRVRIRFTTRTTQARATA